MNIWLILLILLALALLLGRKLSQQKRVSGAGPGKVPVKDVQVSRADQLLRDRYKVSNQKYIDQLNPAVRRQFENFITEIQNRGYTVVITSGYRSFQKQAELKKQDSRNAAPGYSSHNYGTAIDINLVKDGKMIRKDNPAKDWLATGIPQLGKEKYGFRWGGEFDGYPDPVHFDLNNKYDTKKLYAAAIKQYGSVERAKGNELDLSKIV